MDPTEHMRCIDDSIDCQVDEQRGFHVMGHLHLPHPSISDLSEAHRTLALSLENDLQALHDRNLEDLSRPLTSLEQAYNAFRVNEARSWELAGQKPSPGDTLVRVSGSLESPLAHHLIQPSHTTFILKNGGETADPSNGCIAMIMGNLYVPGTLVFDHLHRRSKDSDGLKAMPKRVLDCHERYTREICESMLAKVQFVHGRKVRERMLSTEGCAYKFTALPLWGAYEGVVLYLAHESNYCNANMNYKFRRICLFVLHPQKLFYEPKGSAVALLHDKIHIAASRMIGIPVKESYFGQREFVRTALNPFRATTMKHIHHILSDLRHSEDWNEVEQAKDSEHDTTTTFLDTSSHTLVSASFAESKVLTFATGHVADSRDVRKDIKKKTREPRKNPRQSRSHAAHSKAILHIQTQFLTAEPTPELFSIRNQHFGSKYPDHEPAANSEAESLSRRTAEALKKEYSDDGITTPSSTTSDSTARERVDGARKRRNVSDGKLWESIARNEATKSVQWMETYLTGEKKNSDVGAVGYKKPKPTLQNERVDLASKQRSRLPQNGNIHENATMKDSVRTPLHSAVQDKQHHYFRNLNLVKVDDMDCATRHDRLRTFKLIVDRGDELTEVELAQRAELEAKGTRVHRRDLSKIRVMEMDTQTKVARRRVLRKKIDRHEVLNEVETEQVNDFGMFSPRSKQARKS